MQPDELKAFRDKRGLTQQGLADLLGVERNTVNRWEMGERRIPQMAEKLIRCLVLEKKLLKKAST